MSEFSTRMDQSDLSRDLAPVVEITEAIRNPYGLIVEALYLAIKDDKVRNLAIDRAQLELYDFYERHDGRPDVEDAKDFAEKLKEYLIEEYSKEDDAYDLAATEEVGNVRRMHHEGSGFDASDETMSLAA